MNDEEKTDAKEVTTEEENLSVDRPEAKEEEASTVSDEVVEDSNKFPEGKMSRIKADSRPSADEEVGFGCMECGSWVTKDRSHGAYCSVCGGKVATATRKATASLHKDYEKKLSEGEA